jgi:predicted transcriptional regulator
VIKWFLNIFRGKRDEDRCEKLIDMAYERGQRDTVAYIVACITSKFIPIDDEYSHIIVKLMESTWNREKREDMMYCIIHYNSNKDRTKCLFRVIGVDPDIIEKCNLF